MTFAPARIVYQVLVFWQEKEPPAQVVQVALWRMLEIRLHTTAFHLPTGQQDSFHLQVPSWAPDL